MCNENYIASRENLPFIQKLVDSINKNTESFTHRIIIDFLKQEGLPESTKEVPFDKYFKYLMFYSDRIKSYGIKIMTIVDDLRTLGWDVKVFMQDYTLTLYGIISENLEEK